MKKANLQRRGYALLLVMMFVVLFSAVLGVAWRRVASALRIEQVSEIRKQCDRGSIQVLAQAIQVLETRLRWNRTTNIAELYLSDTATPGHPINVPWRSNISYNISGDGGSQDMRWYIITFTNTPGSNQWTINVTSKKNEPTDLDPLPNPL